MTDDRELIESITSDEHFAALDDETKQRVMKQDVGAHEGIVESHAEFTA